MASSESGGGPGPRPADLRCRASPAGAWGGGPANQRLAYGGLVAEAAALIARSDPDVELKPAGQCRLIGRSQRRIDGPSKTDGGAVYGIDIRLPGMRRA